MRLPKGAENTHRYGLERHVRWEFRPNPCTPTRHCVACGRVLMWSYRDGELWFSPFYYCTSDKCNQVKSHRMTYMEEYSIEKSSL